MASQLEADRALEKYGEFLLSEPKAVYAAVVQENDDWVIEVGILQYDGKSRGGLPPSLPVSMSFSTGEDSEVPVFIKEAEQPRLLYRDRRRPALGGDSIGNSTDPESAGTLGTAITMANYPNRTFIISNSHVLVGSTGNRGDIIIQPCILDGGNTGTSAIGTLRWGKFGPFVDLAIAETQAADVGVRTIRGNNNTTYQLNGMALPEMNTVCFLVGRTSNSFSGVVRAINTQVTFEGQRFVNQIFLERMLCQPGDSGAILSDTRNRFVGMLFAGGNRTGWANRSDEIEKALASATF